MGRKDELSSLLGRITLRARVEGVEPAGEIDLTFLELRALAKLASDGPLCRRDLASALSVAPSSITTASDRLEDRGLVRRQVDAKDRRRVVLHATDSATFALQQSTAGFSRVAAALLENLPASQQDDLLRLLRRATQGFSFFPFAAGN